MSSSKRKYTGPTGGIAFFLSLGMLLLVGAINSSSVSTLFPPPSWREPQSFLIGMLSGAYLASRLIRGSLSVLLHELKHSIFSNFAGNKAKELHVESESGHFSYEYTKQTKAYNAFISLAPYWFPLFTLLILPLCYIFIPSSMQGSRCFLVGIAYGVDVLLGLRDISPVQTDIAKIRGGYGVGLLYIAAVHLVVGTIMIAWGLAGNTGVGKLLEGLGETVYVLMMG